MRSAVVILTFLALLLQGLRPAQPAAASTACAGEAGQVAAACCDQTRGAGTTDDKGDPQSRCRSCPVCNLASPANLIATTTALPLVGADRPERAFAAPAAAPVAIRAIPAVPPPRA